MCAGDDCNCPDFELHRQRLLDDLDAERRSFLKSAFAATGGAAALTAGELTDASVPFMVPVTVCATTGKLVVFDSGTGAEVQTTAGLITKNEV